MIAALTIPNLAKNTQAMQYKTAFKKAVAEINQSLAEYIAEEGQNLAQTQSTEIQGIFLNYLKAKRVPDNNRWRIITNIAQPAYEDAQAINLTASATVESTSAATYFKMQDNITVIMSDIYACGKPHIAFDTTGAYVDAANNGCIAYIDVNGQKGPNMALMGVKSSDPAVDACAKIVPPETNYLLSINDNDKRTYCELTDNAVTDVFPIVFFNDKVYPATVGGYWVLNDLIGQTVEEEQSQE